MGFDEPQISPQPKEVTPEGQEPTTEQPTQAELLDKLFAGVEDTNRELGGELGYHFETIDGSSDVILFRKLFQPDKQRPGMEVFGISTKLGPIILHDKNGVYTAGNWEINDTSASIKLSPSQFRPIADEKGMGLWKTAFTESRDAVLRDVEARERIKKERQASLLSAIELVTEPINLDSPPPPPPTEPVVGV